MCKIPKCLYLMILACIASVCSSAVVATESELWPRCGGIFQLCGYIDSKSQKVVIPQKFERTLSFSEGIAAVRENGLYGYIDRTGKWVIEPRFRLAGNFTNGLAEVLIGDHTGVINRKGTLVIDPQFARSIPLTEKVVAVRKGDWRNTHFRGHEKLHRSFYRGPWALYHVDQGSVTEAKFHLRDFDPRGGDLIWAHTGNRLYGLLRTDGTWQANPQFTHVQSLREDRAIVRKQIGEQLQGQRRNELSGAVDGSGKVVIPIKYKGLSYWDNGYGLVSDGKKTGLIDKSGNILGGRLFDKAQRPEVGDIGRVMIDGKWIGLDKNGEFITDKHDGPIVAQCPSRFKVMKKINGYQIIGTDGKPTTDYLFEYAAHFKLSCSTPNPVRLSQESDPDKKWSYIDGDGQLLFDPPPFKNLTEFSNGYALIQKDSKWGIIDENGKYRVEPQYDTMHATGSRRCVNGIGLTCLSEIKADTKFIVTKGNDKLAIDMTGKRVAMPPNPSPRTAYQKCGKDAQFIHKMNIFGQVRWGIADNHGNIIIKPKYRALHCFKNGLAWGAIDVKRSWCPIGPNGIVRARPSCVKSRYPYIQTHSSPEKFADSAYENSVLWTRAFLDYGAGKRASPPKMIGRGPAMTIMR